MSCSFNLLGQVITKEAESGTLTGVDIVAVRGGFSGSGYVSGFDADGDQVAIAVNVPSAGNYVLKIKYAIESGFGAKTNDVYHNGVLVTSKVFPEAPTFTSIDIATILCTAGDNTITVKKNWGYFDVDNISLTAEGAGNKSPVADAGLERVLMDVDGDGFETVSLIGSGSSDADGTITSYQWRNANGTIIENNNVHASANLPSGDHEIILKVTDNEGATAEDRVKIFVGHATNHGRNRLPLRKGTERKFVSGVNLAWDNFANDLDVFDEAYFTKVFDDVKAAGGNSLRWWLHTNGKNSPVFATDGKVVGIQTNEIVNMRRALDLAYERGIVISMCLWSFDMLQNQGNNQTHMKQLIENKVYTQTYIDKALIPMLEELGNHPAVMTWEIFNEGEGMTQEFGWANMKTQIKYVQQFVNLVAGAIHRNAPGALVSNSGWSFKAGTDKGGNINYYRDDRLIAAGGDNLGTLDFYQIHYYPEHFDNEYSPFHRPASYWGLDKPIVIGEFPIRAIDGRASPNLTTTEAYRRAIEYGYAGVMSWSYDGFDGGVWNDAIPGLTYIKDHYEEAITLSQEVPGNHAPIQVKSIPTINIKMNSVVVAENLVRLDTIFFDDEDGTDLQYSVVENSNVTLGLPVITESKVLNIGLVEGVTGRSNVIIRARDSQGYSTWANFSFNVRDPKGNLALFESTTASTNEKSEYSSGMANDGDVTTRWSSAYADNQFLEIDFGAVISFNRIRLTWEAAYGETYEMEISDDRAGWKVLYVENNGNGGEDLIDTAPSQARYLRINCKARGTAYGFSLWEVEVYDLTTTSNERSLNNRIQYFPNPVYEKLTLHTPETLCIQAVTLSDMTGRKTQITFNGIAGGAEVDVSDVEPGLYFLQVESNYGAVVFKVLVE